MPLPNLTRLEINEKLFDHVAKAGAGKKGCVRHVEPIIRNEDENPNHNCAVDGYLMFKTVEGKETSPENYFGKILSVEVDGVLQELSPLLTRTGAAADRKSEFERKHIDWIKNYFPLRCNRGAGLGSVEWAGYGAELAKITEWYFIDEIGKKGHLFLQLLDTPIYKTRMHMPTGGVFAGRYLYIALVCSAGSPGYIKFLMKMAEAVSRKLGCDGIALASLSNSAGVYYSLGYKFVSKWDGLPLDVSAWTEIVQQEDGTMKTFLRPNENVEPFSQPRVVEKRTRDELEKLKQERSKVKQLYDDAVERARSLYNRLSELSFFSVQ
jgi:hypothetical protein